jgi:hypothetical protein
VVTEWAKSQVFGTSSAGGFRLQVNRSTAPYDYWLEHGSGTLGVIPIAAAYQNLLLQPRRH